MKFFDKLFGKKKPEAPGPSSFLSGTAEELSQTSIECNPEFTEAIRVLMEEDSPMNRERAHRELLKLNIWLPLDEPMGSRREDGMASISFQGVFLQDGTAAVAAFTDPFAMKLFMGTENLAMTSIDLSALIHSVQGTRATDIVINHGGPVGMRLFGEELPYLAKGMSPYSEEAFGEISGRKPTDEEMLSANELKALKSVLSAEPDILTARVTIVEMNDVYRIRAVGIHLAEGAEEFQTIRARLHEAGPDLPLTFTNIDSEEQMAMFEDESIPVYARL